MNLCQIYFTNAPNRVEIINKKVSSIPKYAKVRLIECSMASMDSLFKKMGSPVELFKPS